MKIDNLQTQHKLVDRLFTAKRFGEEGSKRRGANRTLGNPDQWTIYCIRIGWLVVNEINEINEIFPA